ncbi:1326_t:CDS:2, partial [Funneliformis geosporum]
GSFLDNSGRFLNDPLDTLGRSWMILLGLNELNIRRGGRNNIDDIGENQYYKDSAYDN